MLDDDSLPTRHVKYQQGMSAEDKQRLRAAYDQGMSIRELERKTGFSYGKVHRILSQLGPLRPRGYNKPHARQWLAEPAPEPPPAAVTPPPLPTVSDGTSPEDVYGALSPQHRQIAASLVAAHADLWIARLTGLTTSGVARQVQALCAAFGANDRAELMTALEKARMGRV